MDVMYGYQPPPNPYGPNGTGPSGRPQKPKNVVKQKPGPKGGFGTQASSPIGTTGKTVQVGGKNPAAGNPKGGAVTTGPTRQDVLNMQRYLKSQGYDIAIDGVMGPQTQSAKQDYESGVGHRNSKAWNFQHVHSGTPPSAVPPSSDAATGGPGASPVQKTVGPVAPVPASKSSGAVTMADILKMLGSDNYNPKAVAQSEVNATYDPEIAGIKQQLADTAKTNAVKNQHVMDWFNQLVGSSQGIANQANDLLSKSGVYMGGSSAAPAGADPAAADQLGKSQGIYDTNQSKQSAISQSALLNQSPINALRGSEFLQQQIGQQDQGSNDLKSQLTALLGSKGKAYASALDAAMNTGLSRRGEKINQLATMMMLPGQLQGQGIDNALKVLQGNESAATTNSNLAQGAVNLKGTQLDNTMKQIQINQTKVHGAAGINYSDPGVVTSLGQGVQATIAGPKGNFISDPKALWNSIISQYGWQNNARAKQIVASEFQRVLMHSHASKQWMHITMTANGPTG